MPNTGKLITPVQYERGLNGLNEIRPLNRVDTVRRMVSMPVINSITVNNQRIAQGKVLRCTQQGAMLKTIPRSLTLAGTDFIRIDDNWQHDIYHFTVQVKLIMVRVESMSGTGRVAWWDKDWLINIQNITATGLYYWPFNGVTFYLGYSGYGAGEVIAYFSWFT